MGRNVSRRELKQISVAGEKLFFNMVLLFFVKTSNMIIPYPSNRTQFCVSIRLLLRFGSYRIS